MSKPKHPLALSLVTLGLVVATGLTCATCGMLPIADPGEPGFALGSVERLEDGSLDRGRLLEARDLEDVTGHTWPATGWVHYHEGRLDSFDLDRDHLPPGWSPGRELPAGTRVALEEDGSVRFVFLPADATLDGVPVNGGGKVMTGFHADGALRYAFLSHDTELDGIPCEASLFHSAHLHPNGRLARARLSRDFEYAGSSFTKGDEIRLDEEGQVVVE